MSFHTLRFSMLYSLYSARATCVTGKKPLLFFPNLPFFSPKAIPLEFAGIIIVMNFPVTISTASSHIQYQSNNLTRLMLRRRLNKCKIASIRIQYQNNNIFNASLQRLTKCKM